MVYKGLEMGTKGANTKTSKHRQKIDKHSFFQIIGEHRRERNKNDLVSGLFFTHIGRNDEESLESDRNFAAIRKNNEKSTKTVRTPPTY